MPWWKPSREWGGQDAYIIGGGDSLRHFDFNLLRGRNTIGCNSAYVLGAHICKIIVWADWLWWKKIGEEGTQNYGGRVVGAPPIARFTKDLLECPWLLLMNRHETSPGLGTEGLGFNRNCGSLALNLALILGARRVFLLGFDMHMKQGAANWHDLRYEPAEPTAYKGFVDAFAHVARDLPVKFPQADVFNVTTDSNLDYFPKVTPKEHFGCRTHKKEGAHA